ncbi:hypothetical protein ACQPWY_26390 [Pseudonocardia xinjiangensis]|uniref:hypothetical protein n=1 Tax=Pseudonocardia xinjiangensis TaxID=75289 RepID=UPI003D90D672
MVSHQQVKQVTNTITASGNANAIAAGGNVNFDATQHHYYGQLGLDPISRQDLEDARTDFVATPTYESSKIERFLTNRIIVIRGDRRTGRKTAALNLLHKAAMAAAEDDRPLADFWRLRASWLHPSVQALPRVRRNGFLLDLSDSSDMIDASQLEDSRPDGRFGEDLVRFSSKLEDLESYLVVVTTSDVWEHCTSITESITVTWEPPLPSSVIESCLKGQFGTPDRVEWIREDPIQTLLRHAELSPGDAVRLARAIAHAERSGKMSARDAALDEFSGWTKYLHQWFRTNKDVHARAYLIAAAVLNGSPDSDIIRAGDDLLRKSDEEEVVFKPLRAPDISERLARTEATIFSNRRVSLTERRPRLDIAVLDHVWKERPQLQKPLVSWLVDLAIASTAHRGRIATMLAGLRIRRKEWRELLDFAREQAKVGPTHHDLAVQLIDASVLDPDVGLNIRSRLNGWALTKDPVRLSLTVAVCGGRLGTERTDLALKRLAKVLTNKDATAEVIESSGRALTRLATRPETRSAVIDALLDLVESAPKAGGRAFLEMARLGDQSAVQGLLEESASDEYARERIAQLWQATYRAIGTDECAPVMCSWVKEIGHNLPEEAVLAVCLPTLRLTAAHSLDARVVSAATSDVADRIMAELVNHKRQGAGASA